MAEATKKRGGIGSGNTSTPTTTSSNASSSGYGYAPLFEALGILGGGAGGGDDMASAMATGGALSGESSYTDTTDMTGKTNSEIRTAAESAATANPFSIGGVDLGAAGIGMGISNILGATLGGPVGLILGALGSWGAKKLYSEELRNQQQENFFKIIAQTNTELDSEGRAGAGIAPIEEAAVVDETSTVDNDPTNTWINDYINSSSSSSSNPWSFDNSVGGGDVDSSPDSIGSGTNSYSGYA